MSDIQFQMALVAMFLLHSIEVGLLYEIYKRLKEAEG